MFARWQPLSSQDGLVEITLQVKTHLRVNVKPKRIIGKNHLSDVEKKYKCLRARLAVTRKEVFESHSLFLPRSAYIHVSPDEDFPALVATEQSPAAIGPQPLHP